MKRGDLAIFIKCPPQPLNIGLPVEVLWVEPDGMLMCGGNIKPAAGCRAAPGEVPYARTRVHPDWLRRINGNSRRKDETLSWLPVPSRTKEEA